MTFNIEMIKGKRLICFIALLLILIAIINFPDKKPPIELEYENTEATENKTHDFERLKSIKSKFDTWQYIGNMKLKQKVFSAYFDDRKEAFGNSHSFEGNQILYVIRVITILRNLASTSEIFCHFRYENGTIEIRHPSDVEDREEDAAYLVKILACPVWNGYDRPDDIGITYGTKKNLNSFVKIRYPESSEKYNNLVNALAVCVSTPLHSNFTNLLQLVEFVETYKLIGVKKIYFYNDASSKDVGKILNYYKKQGIVEVIEWKTETDYKANKELPRWGLIGALNDCLNRVYVVDNIKYLIATEVNEILVNRDRSETVLDFLTRNDRDWYNSFRFQKIFFFSDPKKDDWSTVPKDAVNRLRYTQVLVFRLKKTQSRYFRTNYVAKVAKTITLGYTSVLRTKYLSDTRLVDSENEGVTLHYGGPCVNDFCKYGGKVFDYLGRKFSPQIWKNVDKVCAAIFKEKICLTNSTL